MFFLAELEESLFGELEGLFIEGVFVLEEIGSKELGQLFGEGEEGSFLSVVGDMLVEESL